MKLYYIILAMAVALIALLGGYAVLQDSQLLAEKARNAELEKKVDSLEKEVSALTETADNYFQRGVDMQFAGNYPEAKRDFEAVITKFPDSNLVGTAKERIIFINGAMTHQAQTSGGTGKADKGTK